MKIMLLVLLSALAGFATYFLLTYTPGLESMKALVERILPLVVAASGASSVFLLWRRRRKNKSNRQ